jgi:hypothetical protein
MTYDTAEREAIGLCIALESTSPSFTTYISSPLSPCSKILVPAAKDIAFEVSAKMLPSLTIGGVFLLLSNFHKAIRLGNFHPSRRLSCRQV